jgi:hypothetical protein
LGDIPKVLRRKLQWVLAESMSDVLKNALLDKPTPKKPAKGEGDRVRARRAKISKRGAKPLQKTRRDRSIPLRP